MAVRSRLGLRSGPVVAHREVKAIAVALDESLDDAVLFHARDAVTDGVFDDGLEEKTRDHAVEGSGIDGHRYFEPVGEADLLDG